MPGSGKTPIDSEDFTTLFRLPDGTPFNALVEVEAIASGEFSGDVTHCAAMRPAEGPLLFGRYEAFFLRFGLYTLSSSRPSFRVRLMLMFNFVTFSVNGAEDLSDVSACTYFIF